jgi:hypothetical protein
MAKKKTPPAYGVSTCDGCVRLLGAFGIGLVLTVVSDRPENGCLPFKLNATISARTHLVDLDSRSAPVIYHVVPYWPGREVWRWIAT